jgi:lipopolysaccharide biosynthesis glycosyltransferase
MKWVFATNQSSLETSDDYPRLIRAAVRSALENTTLQPFMVYDGAPTNFTHELLDVGVTIIQHRLSFYDFVKQYQDRNYPDNRHYLQTATSAFLRVDLPTILRKDEFVLYTDCDVIFLRQPKLESLRPEYFACAPERVRGDQRTININTGVMFMNLANLARGYADFCEFIKRDYANLVAFDQGAYRSFYEDRHDMLPDEMNWKPYWGPNRDAQILHFHGPKPRNVLQFVTNTEIEAPPLIRELFSENPAAYRGTLENGATITRDACFHWAIPLVRGRIAARLHPPLSRGHHRSCRIQCSARPIPLTVRIS